MNEKKIAETTKLLDYNILSFTQGYKESGGFNMLSNNHSKLAKKNKESETYFLKT